jgi:hypothetical protein
MMKIAKNVALVLGAAANMAIVILGAYYWFLGAPVNPIVVASAFGIGAIAWSNIK